MKAAIDWMDSRYCVMPVTEPNACLVFTPAVFNGQRQRTTGQPAWLDTNVPADSVFVKFCLLGVNQNSLQAQRGKSYADAWA